MYVPYMFFAYMMASQKNGTLYTGHTNDLTQRIIEHREGHFPGFSKTYNCHRLVWFEWHESRDTAFRRERQIKAWKRAWKIRRIQTLNPEWDDLFSELTDGFVYDERRQFIPEHL
jgi:putative endonuclease